MLGILVAKKSRNEVLVVDVGVWTKQTIFLIAGRQAEIRGRSCTRSEGKGIQACEGCGRTSSPCQEGGRRGKADEKGASRRE